MPELKVNVKCDRCIWRLEEQNISDWYEKKCPKCNDCIIINDKDLDAYRKIVKLTEILESSGLVERTNKISSNYKGITVNVKFDSAKLRE